MPGVSSAIDGSRDVRRRRREQRVAQPARVVVDRERIVVVEQARKRALEHVAVLEHVRDARGRAHVVLEHE